MAQFAVFNIYTNSCENIYGEYEYVNHDPNQLIEAETPREAYLKMRQSFSANFVRPFKKVSDPRMPFGYKIELGEPFYGCML